MGMKRSVGTHSGPFHADEVTACALLSVCDLIDPDKIVRTRDPKKLAECEFVCDVGGFYDPPKKQFDHHQVDYTGLLSSAGMILRYLHEQGRLSDAAFFTLKNNIVDGVDAHDNGKDISERGVCTFSHVIANMVPVTYDATDSEMDAAFMDAFRFVRGHLERALARIDYIQSCREDVRMAMKDDGPALIFERKLPWIENFFSLGGEGHPATFVIMPGGGHWKLRGIPPDLEHRMGVRIPLPQEWAGLLDDELEKVSGIKGAIFCHKGRFISVWETKEAALAALKKVVDANTV